MKRVYFDKLDSRKNKVLAIPMVIFLIIYIYASFNNRDATLQAVSGIIGFGLSIIFIGKHFFFRNYIGWNKKGITIKLNSLVSKTISFNKIASFVIKNERLEIFRKDGSIFHFKLTNLRTDHIDQIQEILKSNTNANNG